MPAQAHQEVTDEDFREPAGAAGWPQCCDGSRGPALSHWLLGPAGKRDADAILFIYKNVQKYPTPLQFQFVFFLLAGKVDVHSLCSTASLTSCTGASCSSTGFSALLSPADICTIQYPIDAGNKVHSLYAQLSDGLGEIKPPEIPLGSQDGVTCQHCAVTVWPTGSQHHSQIGKHERASERLLEAGGLPEEHQAEKLFPLSLRYIPWPSDRIMFREYNNSQRSFHPARFDTWWCCYSRLFPDLFIPRLPRRVSFCPHPSQISLRHLVSAVDPWGPGAT